MEILNTGWIFPCNAESVICVIGSLALIATLIYLIAVGTTDGFTTKLIGWLIAIACVTSVLLVILIDNRKTTYSIYLTDMTMKELETEYEPYDIDGLILKCTKKGGNDGR
jgi:hypothetical protein